MLSRSGVYALQAALHLAQYGRDQPVSASRMADALDLPPEYLAKVLRRLSKEGVLESTRGVRGGYSLATPPETLSVHRVVRPFEDVTALKRCLLGGPCHEDRPCPAHLRRLEWSQARHKILAATMLTDLLPAASKNGNGIGRLLAHDPTNPNDRT